ncbi:hypothetical protein F4824DRAFT_496622 [Ustulina deusta]|nr:hypothetical protein F4824DRAFT_496622 [Ustulina deusta]
MEVETLLPQLQDTLSQLRTALKELSTKAQNDELDQSEQKRERLLADLETSFQKERQALEAKRQTEQEDIKKKRKQEDEERAAQRQREDEELKKAKTKEDKKRQQKYDREVDSIEDETEHKMDEIEEVAQRMAQEGKKKVHDLDEKRRELNHRIDEQLNQALPTSPQRKRGRPKKDVDNLPKEGTNGVPTSADPKTSDTSHKTASKPDTPSKARPPPAVSPPEKSPEGKKDGELPFQDRTIGPPQAAKEPANNFPRSFAEAVKNNMSNGSKDKPEGEKPSLDQVVQRESVRGGLGDAIPSIQPSIAARSCETKPTTLGDITRDRPISQNTKSLPKATSEVGKNEDQSDEVLSRERPPAFQPIRSNNGSSSINSPDPKSAEESKQQNETNPEQPGSQPVFTENHGPIVSNVGEPTRTTDDQQWRDQPHLPTIDEEKSKQLTRSLSAGESPKEPERAPKKNRAAADTPKAEGHTVASTSTFQPPRLSSTSNERNTRQGNRTHDQVELEQSAIPDLPKQNQLSKGSGSSETLTRAQASGRPSSAPVEPEFLHVMGQQGQQARKKTRSPLPVENETVRGQDQLFDANKSASDISEPDTGEKEPDVPPNIPIEGQSQPVLPEPPSTQRLDEQGLTSLIGEFDNWAILSEQITGKSNEGHFPSISPKFPPVQEYEELESLATQTKTGGDDPQNDSHDIPRPKANMNWQPTPQVPLPPPRPTSPTHDSIHEAEQSQARPDSLSQKMDDIDDQASSHAQPTPIKTLCNHVLSGLFGPTSGRPDSSSHSVPLADPEKSKHRLRSSSTESHLRRSKQRGRPKYKSFQSPERELNPREQLFQGSDDDVNIKSGWFRHSKRGLS